MAGIHPEDEQRFLYVFRNAYASRNAYETVFRLQRKDGIYRWMKIKGTPFHLEGEFEGFVSTCFDITDSKLAHDKLQQSEIKHRKLLEEALVGFLELDTKGFIRYANPSFCKMLKYSQIEILNKNIKDLVFYEDYNYLSLEQKKIIDNKQKSVELEIRYLSKLNTIVNVLVKISGIRNGSGVLSAFNSQVIDLTKRFELEKALQKSNKRFSLALKAGKIGLWEWDLNKNSITWDETHYEIYNLQYQEISIDWDFWEKLIHPKDLYLFSKNGLYAIIDKMESNVIQYRVITSEGIIKIINTLITVDFDDLKHPNKIIGLSWDATDVIIKENELEKQRAIHSFSNRLVALSDMAKIISGELSEPLSEIKDSTKSIAKLFHANAFDQKDRESYIHIQNIINSVDKINEIIKVIDENSKSSKTDDFINIQVLDILSDSISFYRGQFKRYNIEVQTDANNLDELEIFCKPQQIIHAFMTLLSNSIEAIKSLNEKWIRISILKKDGLIEIKFIDSGTVIPQINNGLGLKVLKSLIDINGGQIYFDPLSLHTSFVIELPYSEKKIDITKYPKAA